MVKIEATKFDMRRGENELGNHQLALEQLETQIRSYESALQLLKSNQVKIVSLREYATMKADLPKLIAQRTSLNALVATCGQHVRGCRTLLAKLERDLAHSKFKVLEFRRRERPPT